MNGSRASRPLHVALALVLLVPASVASAQEREPTFLHGFGELVRGVLWVPPKTVLGATLEGPPIAGTVVGVVAGLSRGIMTVLQGLYEMAQAVKSKPRKRRKPHRDAPW